MFPAPRSLLLRSPSIINFARSQAAFSPLVAAWLRPTSPSISGLKVDQTCSLASPRFFATTPKVGLKEIVETISGGQTVVEGVQLEIPKGNLVQIQDADGSFRSILDDKEVWELLSHTDVLILRQFLNTDYTVLPIHVTKLKPYQQDRIEHLVKKAQRANLIPMKVRELKDTIPHASEVKYGEYDSRKYNSYYDDWDKLY